MFLNKILLLFLLILTSNYLLPQSIELRNEYKNTSIFFKEENFIEALTSNNRAIELSKKEFGEIHLTTATLNENKGRLLLELKRFKEAETAFRKVLKVRKKLISTNHPDIAEALDYLALTLRHQNKLSKAITMHNQVLTMMGNVIANNPGQISELSRRSALYRARAYETNGLNLLKFNKLEEAKGNFRIAIKIFDRTLGKNKEELEELKSKLNNLN